MKDIFFRLLVAAALTLAAFALSSSAHGQQADEDATPTNGTPPGRAQQSPDSSETQTRRSAYRLLPRIRLRMNLHLPDALKKKKEVSC
jgi:hypothetical protein